MVIFSLINNTDISLNLSKEIKLKWDVVNDPSNIYFTYKKKLSFYIFEIGESQD